MNRFALGAFFIMAAAALVAASGDNPMPQAAQHAGPLPTLSELQSMTTRFAPADIGADVAALAPRERQALARLVDAAKLMDSLFLRQVWSGNDAMLQDLARRTDPLGRARLHYFLINKGPWSRLDRENDVHDVSRVGVPVDSLRPQ